MSAEEADHERDRGEPRYERDGKANREQIGTSEQLRGLSRVEQGFRAGAEDHGCREEEGEARRVLAPQLARETGGDRDTRAGDSGDQRDRLSDTDHERVGNTDLGD